MRLRTRLPLAACLFFLCAGFRTHGQFLRAYAEAQPAPSWIGSMLTRYGMDESSGTRDNAGTCDAACDLTVSGSGVGNSTSQFIEGMASGSFVNTADSWLICTDANCGSTYNQSGSFTFMSWFRPTNAGVRNVGGKYEATNGFRMLTNTTKLRCGIQTSGAEKLQNSTSNYITAGWNFGACIRTCTGTDCATTNTIATYLNGELSSTTTLTEACCSNTNNFNLGTANEATAFDWHGEIDTTAFTNKALTASQLCHACSCLISGAKCACDSRDPTRYRRCASDVDCWTGAVFARCESGRCQGFNTAFCGSCTLPDCNLAAP